MDGTGELFEAFLQCYQGEYTVIPLPQSGKQHHQTLAKAIEPLLPNEDYILLAESFSGGIVSYLLNSQYKHLKGVVFVASFLSSPNKTLLKIAQISPLKALVSLPYVDTIFQPLLFSDQFSEQVSIKLRKQFINVVKSIPSKTLKSRIKVMSRLQLPDVTFQVPTVYIRPINDKLISKSKAQEVQQVFPHADYIDITGGPFILQSKPAQTAQLVYEWITNSRSD